MQPKLSCSLFELAGKREPLRAEKSIHDIDASNRVWIKGLEIAAQRENLSLDFRVHPFPQLRLHEPAALGESTFDADIAICMYPDLSYVGPELAHLVLNRKQDYRHLFIITQNYLPDAEEELRKAVNNIARASVETGSVVAEPIPLQVINGEDIYDAEEARLFSHWNVRDIRNQHSMEVVQTILAIA